MKFTFVRRILFLLLAGGVLFFPLTSFAALAGLTALTGEALFIIKLAVGIVFTLAVLVFGWGIVKYLTAAGDSAKVKEAQVFLWWGIIGMFVLAAVFGIIQFISTQLNIPTGAGGEIVPPVVQ